MKKLYVFVTLLLSVKAEQSEENNEMVKSDEEEHMFLNQRRNLWTKSLTGQQCETCIRQNKQHCWRKNIDYTGYWTQSYCCGQFDTVCNLYSICSNSVSDQRLKEFTCPVERKSCPIGYLGELRPTTIDTPVSKSETWSNFDIRSSTYCKLHIQYEGSYTTDKFKQNNLNIKIARGENVGINLVYIAPGEDFSQAKIENLVAGQKKIIEKISTGQQWWIMYEPYSFKSGNLNILSWVSLEDLPQPEEERLAKIAAQKDAEEAAAKAALLEKQRIEQERLNKLEAEKQAQIKAEQAELARQQKEQEALVAKLKAEQDTKKKLELEKKVKEEQERIKKEQEALKAEQERLAKIKKAQEAAALLKKQQEEAEAQRQKEIADAEAIKKQQEDAAAALKKKQQDDLAAALEKAKNDKIKEEQLKAERLKQEQEARQKQLKLDQAAEQLRKAQADIAAAKAIEENKKFQKAKNQVIQDNPVLPAKKSQKPVTDSQSLEAINYQNKKTQESLDFIKKNQLEAKANEEKLRKQIEENSKNKLAMEALIAQMKNEKQKLEAEKAQIIQAQKDKEMLSQLQATQNEVKRLQGMQKTYQDALKIRSSQQQYTYSDSDQVIYQKNQGTSYLNIIIGGMIISSGITIVVVKMIKCIQKRDNRTKIESITTDKEGLNIKDLVQNHPSFDQTSIMKQLELDTAKRSSIQILDLKLPQNHSKMTQQDLVNSILHQRSSILQARQSMAITGDFHIPQLNMNEVSGAETDLDVGMLTDNHRTQQNSSRNQSQKLNGSESNEKFQIVRINSASSNEGIQKVEPPSVPSSSARNKVELEEIQEEEIDHDPLVAQQKAWDRIVAKANIADDVMSAELNKSDNKSRNSKREFSTSDKIKIEQNYIDSSQLSQPSNFIKSEDQRNSRIEAKSPGRLSQFLNKITGRASKSSQNYQLESDQKSESIIDRDVFTPPPLMSPEMKIPDNYQGDFELESEDGSNNGQFNSNNSGKALIKKNKSVSKPNLLINNKEKKITEVKRLSNIDPRKENEHNQANKRFSGMMNSTQIENLNKISKPKLKKGNSENNDYIEKRQSLKTKLSINIKKDQLPTNIPLSPMLSGNGSVGQSSSIRGGCQGSECGDEISSESDKSNISHLSLSHTNELLHQMKLDSVHRSNKRETSNQIKSLVSKQADFDREAAKQFKKRDSLQLKLENRLKRLKGKLTPENIEKREKTLLDRRKSSNKEALDQQEILEIQQPQISIDQTSSKERNSSIKPKEENPDRLQVIQEDTESDGQSRETPKKTMQKDMTFKEFEVKHQESLEEEKEPVAFADFDETQRYVSFARPVTQEMKRKKLDHNQTDLLLLNQTSAFGEKVAQSRQSQGIDKNQSSFNVSNNNSQNNSKLQNDEIETKSFYSQMQPQNMTGTQPSPNKKRLNTNVKSDISGLGDDTSQIMDHYSNI